MDPTIITELIVKYGGLAAFAAWLYLRTEKLEKQREEREGENRAACRAESRELVDRIRDIEDARHAESLKIHERLFGLLDKNADALDRNARGFDRLAERLDIGSGPHRLGG